jgi:ferredoxin
MKFKVLVQDTHTSRVLELEEEKELLGQLLDMGLKIHHSCGGSGTCGTCQFECLSGANLLLPKNEIETEFWQERNQQDEPYRLSCQSVLINDPDRVTQKVSINSSNRGESTQVELQIQFHYPVFEKK